MNQLDIQVWTRTAVFIALLALLIFAPAFTFNYWQGWLFWFVFSAATIATSAYLLKHDPALARRRLNAGAAAETERSQKIIQAFATAFVIAMFVVSALDYQRGWSKMPALVSVAAYICVLAGYYIVFLTFKANTFAASTIQVEEQQRVICTGPYAVVRHPMYAGAFLMFIAVPIALASYWGLVPAILLIAAIVVRLLHEERVLLLRLPGYDAYCRSVPYRVIPEVW